jgi:hypothetical protein
MSSLSSLLGRMVCIEFQASVFPITIASDHSITFMVSALNFPSVECFFAATVFYSRGLK